MGFVREIRALRQYGRLPRAQRRLTFYSEGPADWPHLEPLITELVDKASNTMVRRSSLKKLPNGHAIATITRAVRKPRATDRPKPVSYRFLSSLGNRMSASCTPMADRASAALMKLY